VVLMQPHLMQSVPDHRVLVIDQSQAGDVDEIMTEIFEVQSRKVLQETTALPTFECVRLKTSVFCIHVANRSLSALSLMTQTIDYAAVFAAKLPPGVLASF